MLGALEPGGGPEMKALFVFGCWLLIFAAAAAAFFGLMLGCVSCIARS
ncbi:MAG: hypothetical protein HY716_17785 [Planctomycetes bacterium]|nr:hypothetical protein [Planctomycetota bacterium]